MKSYKPPFILESKPDQRLKVIIAFQNSIQNMNDMKHFYRVESKN